MRNIEQTIGNLIDYAKVTIMSYLDEEGYPVSRAMLPPRQRDSIREFLFTTNTSSQKVACYRKNSKASIYFFDPRFFRGVCLTGEMKVEESQIMKSRIWKEGDTMYYKEGVTDPDYCVLKFVVQCGRYYHNFKSEDFKIGEKE